MTVQERIPAIIHEIAIYARADKESSFARAVLLSCGFTQSEISEEPQAASTVLKVFSEDGGRIKRTGQIFSAIKAKGLVVKQKTLKPKDWLTRWKVDWKPARLTKQLDVVPVWCKSKYHPQKGRGYILMDTLLSFGTGLHETTQIVAQFIEDCAGDFRSFMDIGTGTGVLAMVALKHGAKTVLAVDIGELSVEAAKGNMKVNRLKAVIKKADITKFRHARQYDFVAANLITHDLIDNASRILKFVKPGGYLAVSGISLDNLSKLQRAFRRLPLKCLDIQKGKQWSGLLYQKKMS